MCIPQTGTGLKNLPPSRNEIKAVWHAVIFGQASYFTSTMLIGRWWAVQDLNLGTQMRLDLQSSAFNHFANCPYKF